MPFGASGFHGNTVGQSTLLSLSGSRGNLDLLDLLPADSLVDTSDRIFVALPEAIAGKGSDGGF
jgi:hypothetical protein